MKIEELMVGNLVYYVYSDIIGRKKKSIATVVSIHQFHPHVRIFCEDLEGTILDSRANIEPIPLTKKRILKFGWTKENGSYYHGDAHAPVLQKMGDGWIDTFEDCQVSRVFKFVHELQNLFFIQTGKQLKQIKQ